MKGRMEGWTKSAELGTCTFIPNIPFFVFKNNNDNNNKNEQVIIMINNYYWIPAMREAGRKEALITANWRLLSPNSFATNANCTDIYN